ncbi:hypothetical protein [Streptomyces sp. STR69]|uniref:hypothetical protein n=1 Tax=Streptomyces sp. STR69 TaxID=1796942 RepID=UPI0021C9B0A3|nr:hypothetical protein [Streptomyces sp. STR69]
MVDAAQRVLTAAPYVRAIGGAAVVPRYEPVDTAGVVIKPLSGPVPSLALSFAVRAGREPSPAVAALLKLSPNYTRDDGTF